MLTDFTTSYVQYLKTPRNFEYTEEDGSVVSKFKQPASTNFVEAMLKLSHQDGKSTQTFAKQAVELQLKLGKKVYFTSDWHINHNNINAYAGRPFQSKEEMAQCIKQNYFNTITDDDLVVFGGDLCFGAASLWKQWFSELPGKKIQILGNHDFTRKLDFIDVIENAIFTIGFDFEYNSQKYWVSHYPLHLDYLPDDILNIHGHIHQHLIGNRFLNMCVEHTGYRPILFEDLIKNQPCLER